MRPIHCPQKMLLSYICIIVCFSTCYTCCLMQFSPICFFKHSKNINKLLSNC